ncbi:MAG TPA: hypothetical protein V6C97_18150 [Oculatellaceae cyanobacterium]
MSKRSGTTRSVGINRMVAACAAILMFLAAGGADAKMKLVSGIEASNRVGHLTSDITWYHSLPQAEAMAQKQGRMVFWVQMLGDMAGAT